MIEYPDDYGSHDHSHSHTNDWENHSQEPNGHNQIPQCFNSACDCHRPSLDHQRGESIDNSSSESVVNVPSVVPTTDTAEKCKSSPFCSHNTNGRDLDKPCSVSIPTTDTSDWRERFDEEFCMSGPFTDHLKAFIEKELERAREEDTRYTKAVEAGRSLERARVREVIEGMKRDPDKNHYMQFAKLIDGGAALARDAERYNAGLSDLLEALSDNK